MARLPDTAGLKNEVVMARSQRNFYDHAVRAAGVRIVDVGLPDRYAGAGVRDAEAWEFASAITDRTAAVLYVANRNSQPSLETIVRVAHDSGVPVLVDAAAQLPPASNLRDFISAGADLVCFSGGKAIGGPQGSGILCGRRDLIMSALLQNLDLDIEWEQWNPPASLIDKNRLPGLPPHGIGRSCKVGKETIVGLLVALRHFVSESDDARQARWRALLDDLRQRIGGAGEIREGHVPMLLLRVPDARGAVLTLQNGTPSVQVDPSRTADGWIGVHPGCLKSEDVPALAERLREVL
jgi:L-seryl-tRNA(Ser) seleniumtransferase